MIAADKKKEFSHKEADVIAGTWHKKGAFCKDGGGVRAKERLNNHGLGGANFMECIEEGLRVTSIRRTINEEDWGSK